VPYPGQKQDGVEPQSGRKVEKIKFKTFTIEKRTSALYICCAFYSHYTLYFYKNGHGTVIHTLLARGRWSLKGPVERALRVHGAFSPSRCILRGPRRSQMLIVIPYITIFKN